MFPFNPEPIIANNIDEGPTRGIVLICLVWAKEIIFEPGSATFGHPASEINPTLMPFKHGSSRV